MPAQSINKENRISALSAVRAKKVEQRAVSDAQIACNGDWEAAAVSLIGKLPDTSLQQGALCP